MKLAQLFSPYSQLKWGNSAHREVSGILSDSRLIGKNDVFVATRGTHFDGHDFLEQVCAQQVVAVVVEDEARVPVDFDGAILQVGDSRLALNRLASRLYGDPGERLYCVGITGTNGKTTISHMVEAVFNAFSWKTGVIGTVDHHLGEKVWKTELTTPMAEVFYKRLAEFKALGARAFCLEVSSIALDQRRLEGVSFDTVVFSNFTQDHLDYHHDMEEYFEAKQRLFTEIIESSSKNPRFAIVNTDDEGGKKLCVSDQCRLWTYGMRQADFTFRFLKQDFYGSRIQVETPNGFGEFDLHAVGVHNGYNAIAALAVGMAAGISLECCLRGLENYRGVSGRLESIANDRGYHLFVDYAHTSDALEKVLQGLVEVRKVSGIEGRVMTVFGCGGDRDREKRPLMGRVAEKYSDVIFVTSDNPRKEDPQTIIDDIFKGFENPQSQVIFQEVDRTKAIKRAMSEMQAGDVLLIAGKGHEDYQIIGDKKIDFSDHQVVRSFLGETS